MLSLRPSPPGGGARFGLPSGWDLDEDEACRADEPIGRRPCSAQLSASPGPQLLGGGRSSSSTSLTTRRSALRAPRSTEASSAIAARSAPAQRSAPYSGRGRGATFGVPLDLIEAPWLDLGDPVHRAAASAYALPASATAPAPWPDSVRDLAVLDEALRSGTLALSSKAGVVASAASSRGAVAKLAPHRQAEEAALAQALEKKAAGRRAADATLKAVLKHLSDLEAAASSAAAPPAAAATPANLGVGGSAAPPAASAASDAAPALSASQSTAAATLSLPAPTPSSSSTAPAPTWGLPSSGSFFGAATTPGTATGGAPTGTQWGTPLVGATAPASGSTAFPAAVSAATASATGGSASLAPLASATAAARGTSASGAAGADASNPAPTAAPATAGPVGVDGAQAAASSAALLADVEAKLVAFNKDANQKDLRIQVKKTVNLKIGQISATWSRIRECTQTLFGLLDQHPERPDGGGAGLFVRHALAFRLADEAEVGLRSQARAVWPLVEVAVRIFERCPAVEDNFRAIVARACPHVHPDVVRGAAPSSGPLPGQKDGETFGAFADRMVPFLRLWLAVSLVQGDFGVIWRWFARTLNSPPTPLSVTLVHAALELAGKEALDHYKGQFRKLVQYVSQVYLPEAEALKADADQADRLRAALSRLRLWLELCARGRAPLPEGRHVQADQEVDLDPNV